MKGIHNFCRMSESRYALETQFVNLYFYDLPAGFQDEYKTYDVPRFCTILTGKKEIKLNHADSFVYQKDQFLLLPPETNIMMTMPERTLALVYEFDHQLIHNVQQRVCDKFELPEVKLRNHAEFKSAQICHRIDGLHQRVQLMLQENDPNMDFLIELTTQELIYELLKQQGCYEILAQDIHHPINKAIRMMQSDRINQLNVSDIADELDMSLANFSQRFKQMMDITPKEYLTRQKMNKSKQLLRNHPVHEVAAEMGYENPSHFIRLFKEEFGITPKQFQLQK